MNAEGKKGTTQGNIPRWEAELWSYLSKGDGIHCPVYQSCQARLNGVWCLSDHYEYCKIMDEFIDGEDCVPGDQAGVKFEFPACPTQGRIFKLVRKLARKYQEEAGIDRLPVPTALITQTGDKLPIEVRQVPLKAHHGAVWRLSECWLVQLNSNDTPARQRFTLYHEIFHILAHCKATPVFKKTSYGQEGYFNELLADHFAGVILMPDKLVMAKWAEAKDISRMATLFAVPKPLVWFALKHLSLI